LTCATGIIVQAFCQEQQIQTDHAPLRIFFVTPLGATHE
jgi:hypothetical protein